MTKVDLVIAKLKELTACRTDVELAKELGTSSSTISTWKARQAIPYDLVARVSEERNVPFAWFFTEEVPGASGRADVPGVPVPLLKRIPDAGTGGVDADVVATHLCLPGVPASAFAVTVGDDGMAPRIKEGDVVVFVPAEAVHDGDAVVATDEWGELLVRRWREKGGTCYLVAENPEYRPVEVNPGMRLHGKVIDVWRRLKV